MFINDFVEQLIIKEIGNQRNHLVGLIDQV